MGDEQTPQSDLIDDAIRQAEQQLEAKLEALRMSALGEITPSPDADDDIAVLRPTGPSVTSIQDESQAEPPAWQEAAGADLTFQPTESMDMPAADAFVPQPFDAVEPSEVDDTSTPRAAEVTGLVANWEPEEDFDEDSLPTYLDAQQPETSHPRTGGWDTPAPAPAAPAVPTADELQFWSHTRTALRNLQQTTDAVAGQVSDGVVSELDRLIREEAAATATSLRLVQQQVQQGFPKTADRIEGAIEQGLAAPVASIRQLRDELPMRLDEVVRETRAVVREDADQVATSLHVAVQKDVAQLEQSIATNVTRMTHGVTEGVGRVERDVDTLGETVVRFERGVHSEFDRVEAQLRASIERVEQTVREDLVEPSETVKKLDEELPARFSRVERTLLEQMQSTQRDLSTVLTGLVEANRAALDRIAAVASTLDEERTRRTEDVELVVDTVTTGWEGLAAAVKALFTQGEETTRRLAEVERQIGNVRDLETTVQETMADFKKHVANLTPAPVVVTVSHPEAEVRNSARGGWLPDPSK